MNVAVEARRQLTRRRTQLALALVAALPVIIWAAFWFGGRSEESNEGGAWDSLAQLATDGASNFALLTLLSASSFLLVVVVALFFGDAVASEASWGSLRYLLAIPVRRSRLLGIKLVVSALYSAAAIVLLVGVALAIGGVAYGWSPLQTPLGGQMSAGTAFLRLLGITGYIALTLLAVGALAFLLSVSTDSPLGAVGGAVLIYIVSNILDAITALGSLRTVLPGHFGDAWLGLLSSPAQTDDMVSGAISSLIYAATFFSLAWWRFLRKDIVS